MRTGYQSLRRHCPGSRALSPGSATQAGHPAPPAARPPSTAGPTPEENQMSDQYTFADPTKLYSGIETKEEYQEGSGLDAELENRADLGEKTYRGTGRLEGRKALVTGGAS